MKIGDLRKQIDIQSEQPTADNAGGYALAWVTQATVWAEIDPVTGREIYVAGHLEGRVTHKITTRYRSDVTVTSDMRAVYGSRIFNIHAVINMDETNQYWLLLVEEGGPS